MAGSLLGHRFRETASVLQADEELAGAMDQPLRERAIRESVAAVVRVGRGQWDAREQAQRTRGGHGFLVLDGLLVRRVGIGDRFTAEIVGPGDLVRPLDHDGAEATLPFEATWRVLEPLALAELDRAWTQRMCAFPEVSVALTGRAMQRSRRLANMFAITSHPHLEERLLLLMWELADRYGRVGRDGVHVRLQMTHEVLSELAAARRPSVSGALSRLAATGALRRTDDGWLLTGEPPIGGLAARPARAALRTGSEAAGLSAPRPVRTPRPGSSARPGPPRS
jgi:CRP/FNR family cyclic AMP-dependent transcriptional regulator